MERAFRRFPCSVMAVKAISSIGMPALLQDGGAVPVPIGGDMVVSRVVAMHACSRCPPTKKKKRNLVPVDSNSCQSRTSR